MHDNIVYIIYKELNLLPLTDQEKEELRQWLAQSQSNVEVYSSLTDEKQLKDQLKRRFDWQHSAEKAFAKFTTDYPEYEASAKVEPPGQVEISSPHRIPVFKRTWFRYAAAIVVIFGIAAYFRNVQKDQDAPLQSSKLVSPGKDVAPGASRAILTLAGGGTIVLDSVGNGMIAKEGEVNVIKSSDGQITYRPGSVGNSRQEMFNTMSTPRGGQYQITLSDGTKVWLNAASSITYPTSFSGNKRQVSIVGEVYLEVAKNPNQAFVVKIGESEIEVLGTHFNINAYSDEPAMKTTLLEGKIKISKGSVSAVLLSGDQAVIGNQIQVDKNIDIDLVMAWKNGLFEFKDQSVESIMRQVARWYNVNVIYEGKIDYHFNASISRNVPISRLFHLLEATGMVHFTISNNTIVVKS